MLILIFYTYYYYKLSVQIHLRIWFYSKYIPNNNIFQYYECGDYVALKSYSGLS